MYTKFYFTFNLFHYCLEPPFFTEGERTFDDCEVKVIESGGSYTKRLHKRDTVVHLYKSFSVFTYLLLRYLDVLFSFIWRVKVE